MKTSVYLIIKEVQQNDLSRSSLGYGFYLFTAEISTVCCQIKYLLQSVILNRKKKNCQCQSTYEDSLEMLFHGSYSSNKMSSLMELGG